MGCIKLSILDVQYKKISSHKELTFNFCAKNVRSSQFTAAERDAESGMDYMSAKYYNSDGCTFISRDLYFEKFFWISGYSYCKNNPVNRIDPDGNHDYGRLLDTDDSDIANIFNSLNIPTFIISRGDGLSRYYKNEIKPLNKEASVPASLQRHIK